MKKIRMRHLITLLTIIGLVSFGSTAMAYRGWKADCGDCERGSGDGQGRRGGGNGGPLAELTEEQRTQLDELRKAFREDTQELRDSLRDKGDELRDTLTADEVNVEAATALQTEISGIKAQLDEKRLLHRIEVHKLFPELEDGRRFKGGRGKGPRGGCDKL